MAHSNDAFDGYPEWEELHSPDQSPWITTLVELSAKGENKSSFASAVDVWLNDIKTYRTGEIAILPLELNRLQREIVIAGRSFARLMLFAQRSTLKALATANYDGFDLRVILIGKPFEGPLPSGKEAVAVVVQPENPGQPDPAKNAPIIGIIDDGIAFLNARFCKSASGTLQTRFLAVWLQSEVHFREIILNNQAEAQVRLEAVSPADAPPRGFWSAAAINAALASGQSEAALYRQSADDLYPLPAQQATKTSTAHGTHMLDTAAGADPSVGGPPLLAVQLAPGLATDTSGRRLEAFLIMGLRWIVWNALTQDRNLVVNLSLGSLAGPGDAGNTVADAIAYEIDAFRALSLARLGPGKGKEMTVVVAYGNAWRSNLVADIRLEPGKGQSVDWRILPDDYTSNFLEVRVPVDAKGIALTLRDPNGQTVQTVTWNGHGPILGDPAANSRAAAILPLALERTASPVLLAVAPTARMTVVPADPLAKLALAGAWTVTVTLGSDVPACLVGLHVQRNDTPVGYRYYGRQSYLGDADLDGWDDETRDYTKPGERSAIQRAGTANSYAGLKDIAWGKLGRSLLYVGAARPNPDGRLYHNSETDFLPSPYTAEGYSRPQDGVNLHVSNHGPTLSAVADEGRFLPGRRGASVTSGPRSLRLSGTSVAAGLVTRWVADKLGLPGALQQVVDDLTHANTAGLRDSRLGLEVIGDENPHQRSEPVKA